MIEYQLANIVHGWDALNFPARQTSEWETGIRRFIGAIRSGYWSEADIKKMSVEELADRLKQIITDVYEERAKRARPPWRPMKYWWNNELAELRRISIACRRKVTRLRRKKMGNEEDKAAAQAAYSIATQNYKTEIKKAKELAWEQMISVTGKVTAIILKNEYVLEDSHLTEEERKNFKSWICIPSKGYKFAGFLPKLRR